MAFFRKKYKEEKSDKKADVSTENFGVSDKSDEKAKKSKAEKEKKLSDSILRVSEDIIWQPWITEKAHAAMTENKYVFKVKKNCSKNMIANAIEKMYGVKVIAVNVVNVPAKKRMYGRYEGLKSGYRKAVVTLREGDKIELFKGA